MEALNLLKKKNLYTRKVQDLCEIHAGYQEEQTGGTLDQFVQNLQNLTKDCNVPCD